LLLLFFIFNQGGKSIHSDDFFVIKRGDNVFQIAANLKRQGYISSQLAFTWEVLISGNFKKMKAGKYQISEGEAYEKLIKKFTESPSAPINILVAPGKTVKDISLALESLHVSSKGDFLNLAMSPGQDFFEQFPFLSDRPVGSGLEGYLFPDSYRIDSSASVRDITVQMLDNFGSKLTPELSDEIKKQKRTIFQIVTMASILEKEVNNYADKQIVAGILWKRADNHLPLEVDSTLLYFQTSLHPSALEKNVDSPYNTYKYAGLPQGPICNPGLESIKAAIFPQETDYWFYLSAPDGKTIFAKTLGQHLINKAKYLNSN